MIRCLKWWLIWTGKNNVTWIALVTFHPASQVEISLVWSPSVCAWVWYSGSWWQSSDSWTDGPFGSSLSSLWVLLSSSLLAKFTFSSSVSRQMSHLTSLKKRHCVPLKHWKKGEKVCFRWAISNMKFKIKSFFSRAYFFSSCLLLAPLLDWHWHSSYDLWGWLAFILLFVSVLNAKLKKHPEDLQGTAQSQWDLVACKLKFTIQILILIVSMRISHSWSSYKWLQEPVPGNYACLIFLPKKEREKLLH